MFQHRGREAEAMLEAWLQRARRCQIPAFVELYHRIKKHRAGIIASVTHGLSNGLTENVNTKLRLLTRIAYGFGAGSGLAAGEWRAVEVAELVGGAGDDGGPGAGDELAGDCAIGLGVAMTAFDHESSVELGELWVSGSGYVGGLVEGEAQHRRAFLRDRSSSTASAEKE